MGGRGVLEENQGGFIMREKATRAVGGIINIEDNVIIYKDTVICADNISMINLSKTPKTSYGIGLSIMLVGVYFIGGGNLLMIPFGIVLLICGLILSIVFLVMNLRRPMCVNITMNSGNIFYFASPDMRFLNDAMNATVDCIAEGRRGKVSINLENSTVTNSSIGNTISRLKN